MSETPRTPPSTFGRSRRAAAAVALAVAVAVAGCSTDRATTATTLDQRAATESLSTNPFIPDDVNIGDCVSSLPRPGCGNEVRGDSHSLITFGVLAAGLAFIGWRIARSVRRRDSSRPGSPSGTTPSA